MAAGAVVLRGAIGARLQGDETRAERTEATASGATYDEAFAALQEQVPDGHLLLHVLVGR